jgi:predicted alpha/beta superfamily hydrolase
VKTRDLVVLLGLCASNAFAQEAKDVLEIEVEVPATTKGKVYLAIDREHGGKAAWAPDGVPLVKNAKGRFFARVELAPGDDTLVRWKVTRGDWATVEKGVAGEEVTNRETRVKGPTRVQVKVARWADDGMKPEDLAPVSSSVVSLGELKPSGSTLPARPVFVWLPPGYAKDEKRRYPVLYVLDGQNQFDRRRAFQGVTWELEAAGVAHVASGHEAFITVAIDNAREQRADEYLPSRVKMKDGEGGGRLEEFVSFIKTDVKPAVDARFRTKTGPEETGILGSSFGGIAAFHMGWKHPELFRRVGSVSPSLWWNDEETLALVKKSEKKPPLRLWLDMGTREEKGAVATARRLRDALVARGFKEGDDLHYMEDEGARHDEAAWAKRLPGILAFLFP